MNLPHVTIREATEEDIPQLCELLSILFTIEADFKSDFAKQKAGLTLLLHSPTSCILVAELSGKSVGMCTGQLHISTAEGSFSVIVEDVIVHPHYQQIGIGTLLLKSVENFIQKHKAKRAQLVTDKCNATALSFYRKKHWKTTQLVCLNKHY